MPRRKERGENMTNKLKCPKCGRTNLFQDDCYETIHEEGNTYKKLICGHCEDCGIDLQWVEVYKFVGYEDMEES